MTTMLRLKAATRRFAVLSILLAGFSAFLATPAFADGEYVVTQVCSASGSACVVTVQQPSTPALAKRVSFHGAAVTCSVDCTFTIERNGTAATATSQPPTGLGTNAPASAATAYINSDVGSGTVISNLAIPAGGTMSLDLSKISLQGTTTTSNLTIRTNSITGTVRINITFAESAF